MPRKPSTVIVVGFDPNKDPSVAEMLKQEQARNPKVERVYCISQWGMVQTPKGLYCLTDEGVGPEAPIDATGLPVEFYREFAPDEKGQRPFEPVPFAMATFSPDEVKACATGVSKRLDEFIGVFGRRKEQNYEEWERTLS